MVKKSLIDNPVVSRQIFYPQKRGIPSSLSQFIKVLELQIEKKIIIGGFFYENDPKLPTILLFHGNGEIAEGYYGLLDFFFDCGVNLAVVDYRGYGFSSGQPFYTSLLSDAVPIYNRFSDWINEKNIKDSIFVLGRSIGSACASEIGAYNPPNLRGIIFESGFASIYNMMTRLFRVSGPSITPEGLREYSNDTRILKFKKPTLIIHGTQDFIIPYDESKIIYDCIPDGVEKSLILIENAGHNDIFLFKDEYIAPLKDFIKKNK
ncbi:MAG: alpha/beta hydrolase [Candidatus Thorarchaeota archaeon]